MIPFAAVGCATMDGDKTYIPAAFLEADDRPHDQQEQDVIRFLQNEKIASRDNAYIDILIEGVRKGSLSPDLARESYEKVRAKDTARLATQDSNSSTRFVPNAPTSTLENPGATRFVGDLGGHAPSEVGYSPQKGMMGQPSAFRGKHEGVSEVTSPGDFTDSMSMMDDFVVPSYSLEELRNPTKPKDRGSSSFRVTSSLDPLVLSEIQRSTHDLDEANEFAATAFAQPASPFGIPFKEKKTPTHGPLSTEHPQAEIYPDRSLRERLEGQLAPHLLPPAKEASSSRLDRKTMSFPVVSPSRLEHPSLNELSESEGPPFIRDHDEFSEVDPDYHPSYVLREASDAFIEELVSSPRISVAPVSLFESIAITDDPELTRIGPSPREVQGSTLGDTALFTAQRPQAGAQTPHPQRSRVDRFFPPPVDPLRQQVHEKLLPVERGLSQSMSSSDDDDFDDVEKTRCDLSSPGATQSASSSSHTPSPSKESASLTMPSTPQTPLDSLTDVQGPSDAYHPSNSQAKSPMAGSPFSRESGSVTDIDIRHDFRLRSPVMRRSPSTLPSKVTGLSPHESETLLSFTQTIGPPLTHAPEPSEPPQKPAPEPSTAASHAMEQGDATRPPVGIISSRSRNLASSASFGHAPVRPRMTTGPVKVRQITEEFAVTEKPEPTGSPSNQTTSPSRQVQDTPETLKPIVHSPRFHSPSGGDTPQPTSEDREGQEGRTRVSLRTPISTVQRSVPRQSFTPKPIPPPRLSLRHPSLPTKHRPKENSDPSTQSVPVFVVPFSEISSRGIKIAPQLGYALSQVDGFMSVQDISDIVGMPAESLLQALMELHRANLVKFE